MYKPVKELQQFSSRLLQTQHTATKDADWTEREAGVRLCDGYEQDRVVKNDSDVKPT